MLSASSHVFSEICLHFTWHCKDDRPFLRGPLEGALHAYMADYCDKTKGVKFFGIGNTSDHVHLVAQVEPDICPADWVGKIKGASSHDLNERLGPGSLQWQRGYGVVSFARRDMDAVLRYVARQKEHHGEGTANAILERHGDFQERESEESENG